jgi:hypothetical protein
VVSQDWLHRHWRAGFTASHLSWTTYPELQHLAVVKVHGVFPSNHGYSASSPRLQFHRIPRRDSAQLVTPFVQVGTSRDSSISGGADYPFTLGFTKGRRLITSVDLPPSAAENAMSRPEGRSVVTGSTHAVDEQRGDFPRDYPFAMTTSLKASRTRRASPLLAGLSARIAPDSGNSITRQGISLP